MPVLSSLGVNLYANSKEFVGGLRRATGELSVFSKSAKRTTNSAVGDFKRLAAGMVGVGTAVKIVADSIKETAEFNKGFAEVATLGVKNLDMLKSEARDLAVAYGVELPDATKATYQALSAGVPEDNIGKFLETSVKAAKAGVSDLATSVDLGTNVLNAFGMESTELDSVFSKAFIAVKAGKTTFTELADGVGKVAPIFSGLGLTVDDMFASIAALTKTGISTKEAITSLKAGMSNILKPTKDAEEAAEKLGIQFNATALQSKGLSNFLGEIQQKAGGNVQVISDLFGSVEAFNAMLVLTGAQGEDFNNILGEMGTNVNALDEAFNTYNQNAEAAENFAKFNATLTELKITLGEELMPGVTGLTEALLTLFKTTDTHGASFFDNMRAGFNDLAGGVLMTKSLFEALYAKVTGGDLEQAKISAKAAQMAFGDAEQARLGNYKPIEAIPRDKLKKEIGVPELLSKDGETNKEGTGIIDSLMGGGDLTEALTGKKKSVVPDLLAKPDTTKAISESVKSGIEKSNKRRDSVFEKLKTEFSGLKDSFKYTPEYSTETMDATDPFKKETEKASGSAFITQGNRIAFGIGGEDRGQDKVVDRLDTLIEVMQINIPRIGSLA